MQGLPALSGGNAVHWSHFCPAGEQLREILEGTLHLYSELYTTFSVCIQTKLPTSSCLMYQLHSQGNLPLRTQWWKCHEGLHLLWFFFSEYLLCLCVCVCVCVCVCLRACACSVGFNSLQPHGMQPPRLLCSWDSPGKDTRVGCHFLLMGIFPTQGWNLSLLCLLRCRWIFLPTEPSGKLHTVWVFPTAVMWDTQRKTEAWLLQWNSYTWIRVRVGNTGSSKISCDVLNAWNRNQNLSKEERYKYPTKKQN